MSQRPLGPTVSQRILGAELRKLREAKDLTCKDVGAALEFSEAKVSRIEIARNSVTRNDLRLFLDLYKVRDDTERQKFLDLASPRKRQRSWWNAYRDVVPDRRWVFVRLEDEAERLRNYESAFIPGLLQTEEYVDAFLAMNTPEAPAGLKKRWAEVRIARQQVLTREFPVHLWTIIDEAALLRVHALPAHIAQGQLLHLVETAQLPTVTLQVLPLAAGPHAGMHGAFTIIDFPDPAGRVVFLDTRTAGSYLEEAEDINAYDLDFNHLQAEALGKHDSIDLIRNLARDNE